MKKHLFLLLSFLFTATAIVVADPPKECEDLRTVQGKATVTFKRYAVKYLPGRFTVSTGQEGSGNKVRFSQGNLQYRAESGVWRFAENQWDYIGNAEGNITESSRRAGQTAFIDLFGWGTSGATASDFPTSATATAYQPWATSTSNADYCPGGSNAVNIAQGSGYEEADWAWHNKIQNGGNAAHQWRVLTAGEWRHLFQGRDNAANLYGFGKVHGVQGVILLCDDWDWESDNVNGQEIATAASTYSFTWVPGTGAYTNNVIPDALWTIMEAAGAVFLPAAGYRSGVSVNYAGSYGVYWSSTRYSETYAYYLYFGSGYLYPQYNYYRSNGYAVRPVQGF